MVRTQQQAFREYYASMTDDELLQIARNRKSFIDVAQQAVDLELRKRHLQPPEPPAPPPRESFLHQCEHGLEKLAHRIHHAAPHH
ncbi:MAG TPA: hypothetical protein VJ732_10525 [Bryobacteraceae bacterium]|nr:hypothetical protein [Bryobacteraceae bacterium]